jgi:hypothetical protein
MGADERSLQGLIDHLGLSSQEAAKLIGLPGNAIGREATRRPYASLQGAVERLAALARQVDRWVAAEIDRLRQTAGDHPLGETRLLIYRRDEDIPVWAALRPASVHRVAMAKIAAAFPGAPPALIVFESHVYFDWLQGRDDTPETRRDWAAQAPGARKFYFKIDGAFSSSAAPQHHGGLRLRRRRPTAAKPPTAQTEQGESEKTRLGRPA